MNELTFEQMLDRQKNADRVSDGYRKQMQQEKDKAEKLQAQVDAALRSGNEDRFASLIAEIEAANSEADKYQRLAAATGKKLFRMDEAESAWQTKRNAFLTGGEYAKAEKAFRSSLEDVYTNFCKLSKLIDTLTESGNSARGVLVDMKQFPFCFDTGVDKNAMIVQIRETLDRCRTADN